MIWFLTPGGEDLEGSRAKESVLKKGRGGGRLKSGAHLHSGTLPPWECEGELVCGAGRLGQQVGVHGCLVLGLGSLRGRGGRVSGRWQAFP